MSKKQAETKGPKDNGDKHMKAGAVRPAVEGNRPSGHDAGGAA